MSSSDCFSLFFEGVCHVTQLASPMHLLLHPKSWDCKYEPHIWLFSCFKVYLQMYICAYSLCTYRGDVSLCINQRMSIVKNEGYRAFPFQKSY